MNKLEKNVQDISNNYYEYLFNFQNVNGVGYGYKYVNNTNTFEPCINVLVKNKIDSKYLTSNNIIPKTYMGIKTDIIEEENSTAINQFIKTRPLKAGCTIGILGDEERGTMCCIVKKKASKENGYEYYILSNNHVLAKSNSMPIGSLIIQPVKLLNESTQLTNVVGVLEKFIQIKFTKIGIKFSNYVDCAIARVIDKTLISNNVLGLYTINGVAKAELGMRIKKSGSTTGINQGTVKIMHLTTSFSFPDNKEAFFKEQISLNLKSAPGDSGSPILTLDDNLIGLNTAANVKKETSICNDINIVLKALKVELYLGEEIN